MEYQQDLLHLRGDGLSIDTPWGTAAAAIQVNDEDVDPFWEPDAAGSMTARHGAWLLRIKESQNGTIALSVENAGKKDRYLDHLVFGRWEPGAFDQELCCSSFREVVHGGSFQQKACGIKVVGAQTAQLENECSSSMFGVYQEERGPALLLGELPPVGQSFTTVRTLHSHRHLDGHFGFEVAHEFRCMVEPGTAVNAWSLVALSGGDGVELMEAYGQLWHDRLQGPPLKAPIVGWNSWSFYSGAVSRSALDENMDKADELFDGVIGMFCIDEGWEEQWGRWQANAKFGHDLVQFCRSATARGKTPGIWVAPLLANTYSPLYREHPEWFALDQAGDIRTDLYPFGPMAYLDTTIPAVLDWLRSLFARLRSIGFGYFKIDFSHCILLAAEFRDARISRSELVRRAFAAIREAVGPDAYVLSCGSPYESVVGLVDAVRTAGDIHIYWSHVLRNAGNLCTRWWMNRKLWNCDPDVLIVRGPDTAHSPFGKVGPTKPLGIDAGWLAGRELSENEARVWALLYCGADDIVLGDCLGLLRPNALTVLRRVLSRSARHSVPVDLFTSEQSLPRIWITRSDQETMISLFNWLDVPAWIRVDLASYGVSGSARDLFAGEDLGRLEVFEERMDRRSCRAIVVAPEDQH